MWTACEWSATPSQLAHILFIPNENGSDMTEVPVSYLLYIMLIFYSIFLSSCRFMASIPIGSSLKCFYLPLCSQSALSLCRVCVCCLMLFVVVFPHKLILLGVFSLCVYILVFIVALHFCISELFTHNIPHRRLYCWIFFLPLFISSTLTLYYEKPQHVDGSQHVEHCLALLAAHLSCYDAYAYAMLSRFYTCGIFFVLRWWICLLSNYRWKSWQLDDLLSFTFALHYAVQKTNWF